MTNKNKEKQSMFFKAVNKITGKVAGWGKDSTREEQEEKWDLKKVDVVEISKTEFEKLIQNDYKKKAAEEKEYNKMWELGR